MLPDAPARALRDAALVVVNAPAGYGKTTVVRAALDGETAVAWYDAQPWEADSFVRPLLATLRAVRPDVGRLTLALADQHAGSERLGATLAGELRHVDAPLRIVVDDAHVLGASFEAFARSLAQRVSDSVRLVLITRAPLDVGLPEAVARGRGALIDASALRFDVSRTRELATSFGVALDEAAANALVHRTEGWPIAVVLSLRAPASSATLLEELVARRLGTLDAPDRALLDQTIAYEVIEPSVAAPADPYFAERFTALAADASLVDTVAGGFRVHPLVRDAIAGGLTGDALAQRHAAAAEAYAAAGRLRPALFHLERARDARADAQFLRRHAATAVESGLTDGVRAAAARVRASDAADAALLALVDGLLAKARGDDGRAAFAAAACAADAHDDRELAFEARLQAVEADLAHGDHVDAQRIDGLIARASAYGAAATVKAIVRAGWADAVSGHFHRALARLDALADAGDPALTADVAPLEAYAHVALGDFEAAERVANALIDLWGSSDDLVRYNGALVWAARFALLRGETTAAYELAAEAERIARPFALRPQAAALHATLGEAALNMADLAVARREARAALRSADAAWYARDAARARTSAQRILARADALDGDLRAALAASEEDEPIAYADAATFAALARAPDASARRERARAALAGARPVDAADAVALWSAAETIDLLDAIEGRAARTALRTCAFDALIARRAQDGTLRDLVPLPRGEALAAALARAAHGGPRFELHVVSRLAARLHGGAPPAAAARTVEPLEVLTAREHEILELLAAGLTNREIAQRLFLSARTVETHVARITGKLGVNSRARAVARAVALAIVAPPAAVP